METETQKKLDALESKIDAIYASVEKTRKYFQWTLIMSFVVLVLPLLGLIFIIPSFISSYQSAMGGGSLEGMNLEQLGL